MADIEFLRGTATVTNGSTTVQITGATGAFVSAGTALFIEGAPNVVEAISGNASSITLRQPWPYDTGTFDFRAFNTLEGLASAIRRLRQITEDSVGISTAFTDIITSTEESITIELSDGDVTVTPWAYLQNLIESEWEDIKQDVAQDVAVTRARLDAMEKLKRNASIYLDFANNEGKEADDFTVVRDDATNLIDYTAADGVSVQTADGRIVFAPANTAALGWNDGLAVGLVSAPSSTNTLTQSQDLTNGMNLSRLTPSLSSADSPVIDKDTGEPVKWTLFTETNESGVIDVRKSAQSLTAGVMSVSFAFKPISSRYAGFFIRNGAQGINSQNYFFSNMEKLKDGSFYSKGSITLTGTSGSNVIRFIDSDGNAITEGQGVDAFYMTAMQQEVGFPTPYIKTEASQVTRGDVSAIKTGLSLSSNSIVIFTEFYVDSENAFSTTSYLPQINNAGSISDYCGILLRSANRANLRVNGVDTSPNGAWQVGRNKICGVLSGGVVKLFVNGSFAGEALADVPSNLSYINLVGSGSNPTPSRGSQPSMQVISLAPITDAEAIALTTLEDE